MGIVLADVAGHGMPAALLMATLRAALRSDYELAADDLCPRLERLNRMLHASTLPEDYATLFIGEYEDFGHRLRYANCGHVAPILMHADGGSSRLHSTSMAIGLFHDWRCEAAEVVLAPGDLLVLTTDGVTEARSALGDEFGEDRLVATVASLRHAPLGEIPTAVLDAVRRFESGNAHDDRTIVVARLREPMRPQRLRRIGPRPQCGDEV
jgi:sigma-B regulation protein RsbU (phosphoserine phosphatase)